MCTIFFGCVCVLCVMCAVLADPKHLGFLPPKQTLVSSRKGKNIFFWVLMVFKFERFAIMEVAVCLCMHVWCVCVCVCVCVCACVCNKGCR